jgi:hypothetical protein
MPNRFPTRLARRYMPQVCARNRTSNFGKSISDMKSSQVQYVSLLICGEPQGGNRTANGIVKHLFLTRVVRGTYADSVTPKTASIWSDSACDGPDLRGNVRGDSAKSPVVR